jgi:hypothetical protein
MWISYIKNYGYIHFLKFLFWQDSVKVREVLQNCDVLDFLWNQNYNIESSSHKFDGIVENLQSHFILTMSHWSSGLPVCFPSQGTQVQIPWGVLMWNRDSPVSVVSLQYHCTPIVRSRILSRI